MQLRHSCIVIGTCHSCVYDLIKLSGCIVRSVPTTFLFNKLTLTDGAPHPGIYRRRVGNGAFHKKNESSQCGIAAFCKGIRNYSVPYPPHTAKG